MLVHAMGEKILAFESLHSSPVPTAPGSGTEGQWVGHASPTVLMLSRNATYCFPLPLVYIVFKNTYLFLWLKNVHIAICFFSKFRRPLTLIIKLWNRRCPNAYLTMSFDWVIHNVFFLLYFKKEKKCNILSFKWSQDYSFIFF